MTATAEALLETLKTKVLQKVTGEGQYGSPYPGLCVHRYLKKTTFTKVPTLGVTLGVVLHPPPEPLARSGGRRPPYGQALFEGLKAFHGADGKVRIFRLDAHLARMQGGVDRLAMPMLDLPRVREGILELITKTRSAIPRGKNEAMYIRPLIIADEGFLGVRPAKDYIFLVLLSPVGDYYEGGMRPLRIWVEKEHVRAAPGGLGAVKTAANYEASLAATHRAEENGP